MHTYIASQIDSESLAVGSSHFFGALSSFHKNADIFKNADERRIKQYLSRCWYLIGGASDGCMILTFQEKRKMLK